MIPAEQCTTHHHACDCREHKVAVLKKAAIDCAIELDWLKNEYFMNEEKREALTAIINRVHAAGENLYPEGEDDIEQARRLVCNA